MARYIDANAFLKSVKQKAYPQSGINESERKISLFGIMEILTAMPTPDVVEVVHGKNISKSGFLCSVCKFGDFDGFHGYEPNFCPNCGADMRGGTE